jgi:V/A-type H+-transporting ATPase subunit E
MSDINRLKASIIEQARREGQEKLAQAKVQVEEEFQKQKAQLLAEKEADRQKKLKEVTQYFQVEAQQIHNQERQSTLVSKQEILKELFSVALDEMIAWTWKEELVFIRKVLQEYSDQTISLQFGELTAQKLNAEILDALKSEFPQLTVAASPIVKEAGFVISVDRIDDTYLYSDLIDSIYKEESSRIAMKIFSEN